MKILNKLVPVIALCMIYCLAFPEYLYSFADSSCSHNWTSIPPTYEFTDDTYHTVTWTCSKCGDTKSEQRKHDANSFSYGYESVDEDSHIRFNKCNKCEGKINKTVVNHRWTTDWDAPYEECDDDTHYVNQKCRDCGETKKVAEKHSFDMFDEYEYESVDKDTHNRIRTCENCGAKVKTVSAHVWEDTYDMSNWSYIYKPYNNDYHLVGQNCEYCGETRMVQRKHVLYSGTVTKEATPTSPGIEEYTCNDCGSVIKKSIPWSNGGYADANYDLDHSTIYRTTKKVTVKLNHGCKGGVLKLKIGSKTYKKKLTSNTKKVKIKIKKPKYGKKIKLTLTYKGEVIGKDNCENCLWDVVWYAKKIKKGMTKKQVKYTWGEPSRSSKSSAGYTHWHYGDGSYVRFKKGKVDYWYSVE